MASRLYIKIIFIKLFLTPPCRVLAYNSIPPFYIILGVLIYVGHPLFYLLKIKINLQILKLALYYIL